MVKVAIVCEGKNDKEFFETLITHLELDVGISEGFYTPMARIKIQ